MARRQAQRAAFTRQLAELRIDKEYGSSGLWDEDGRMLGYDPPVHGDDAWRDRHRKEEM